MLRLALPLLVTVIFGSQKAHAFDPFTVAAVVSTTASAISSISDATSEIAGTADAFSELYSEIDTDAQISEDGQKIIQEVQEVESLAREAGYTAEEIDGLGHQDPNELKRLAGTIKSITRAVKAGKRAYKLVMKLEKKAQTAQVESAQIEKEQLAATYKLIRLQNEANLEATKKELQALVEKKKQIESLKNELKEKGAKTFGKSGVLYFPKAARIVENSITVAKKLRAALFGMMLVVFLVRVVFYQFGFFGVPRYGDLVRDTIVCGLLLMVFPDMVHGILSYCDVLSSQITDSHLQGIQPKELKLPELKDASTTTKLFIGWLFEWIRYGTYAVIDFVMTFGTSFLVMLFPIVIFLSQMMNFSIAWPVFIGGFITVCLWPLFWNLVGLAASLSWGQEQQTFAESLYSIFFSIIQLISPIAGIKILSGQGLSKAMSDGFKAFTNPAGYGTDKLAAANYERKAGLASMSGENPRFTIAGANGVPSVGRIMGSSQGFAKNKLKDLNQHIASKRAEATIRNQAISEFRNRMKPNPTLMIEDKNIIYAGAPADMQEENTNDQSAVF